MSKRHSREWSRLTEHQRNIISSFQHEPAIKLGQMAKEFGLSVKKASLAPGISGEIRPKDDFFTIRVNRHEHKYRQRFTLAHEIAHALLHADKIREAGGIQDNVLYRSSLSSPIEAEANRLAADILMPWHQMKDLWLKYGGMDEENMVDVLSDTLKVSTAAVRIRLGLK